MERLNYGFQFIFSLIFFIDNHKRNIQIAKKCLAYLCNFNVVKIKILRKSYKKFSN